MRKIILLVIGILLLIVVFKTNNLRDITSSRNNENVALPNNINPEDTPPATSESIPVDPNNFFDSFEKKCLENGWKKISITINGMQRNILWKAPSVWRSGAIVALHGGGGSGSNFCNNIKLGQPMVDFSDLAIAKGYAVFAPDSGNDYLKDDAGNKCGKRWISIAKKETNSDILFIERTIKETIHGLRPPESSTDIFMAGISNGGFMTVLVGTSIYSDIRAFAVVSAGDPYGTHIDCSDTVSIRRTPGTFVDNETNSPINERDACVADTYRKEFDWPEKKSIAPFKLFYDKKDGAVDVSCKEKLSGQLERHGYYQISPIIIDERVIRSTFRHFWLTNYNDPILQFFKDNSSNK